MYNTPAPTWTIFGCGTVIFGVTYIWETDANFGENILIQSSH